MWKTEANNARLKAYRRVPGVAIWWQQSAWFHLGCSWRKLAGNPAPHQTRSQDASHTGDWTSLNTRNTLLFSSEENVKWWTAAKLRVNMQLTWVSGWAGVTLRSPATTEVAAALWVGHHHVIHRITANETLIDLHKTHVLVRRSAI